MATTLTHDGRPDPHADSDIDRDVDADMDRDNSASTVAATGSKDGSDRSLYWGMIGITLGGLILRLWELGERAFHHDESLDAWWSWKFIEGTYDGYDPVFHGPLRFYITGLFYIVFGESPTTARLFSALCGAALVFLPWYMRRELGRIGTLGTAVFLALSPSMLYFSRFGREDAQMAFLAGAMIVMAAAYIRKPNPVLPVLFALALSASFAIKESAYLWVGIVGSYGVVALAVQYSDLARDRSRATAVPATAARRSDATATATATATARSSGASPTLTAEEPERKLSFYDADVSYPVLGLLALLGAIIIGNSTPVPGGVFMMLGLYAVAMLGAMVYLYLQAAKVGARITDAPIVAQLVKIGAAPWIIAGALFVVTWVLFFTVWFKYPGDVLTGVTKAISYWNEQQDVNRGGQPWYYYLVAIPAYEWFFIILAGFGMKRVWRNRTFANGLLVWIAVASLILYSYAGERMPWLIIHPLLPVLFLAGIGVQELFETKKTAAMQMLSLLLIVGFAFTVFTSIRASFVTDTDGRELFVQAGQATEHVTIILDELEELDRISRAELGRPLTIALGSEDAWPWAYYFHDREYITWDSEKTPEVPDVDVLIANNYLGGRASFLEPATELPNHTGQRFAMRVWWVPANKPDSGGQFTSEVSYFDTNDDPLFPTRAVEWLDWIVTKEAGWEWTLAGGCGSVDQWFMVSNELLEAARRAGTNAGSPTFEKLPCASNEMSYNVPDF